ncbi:Ribosomal RNA-processing protein 14/surfeit locus protein 6, C-terminal domain [Phytophthora cactorum]|nr:Ribosomal RNA-processing protein 14/surfeit locus protein 6, C-terminal domain [Phytophthora cactorum]
MLLGRRLLQAATQDAASDDETLRTLKANDRFFCETMEIIPAAFYFPTDAEANWKKSAPKKYHKNVQALKQQESSKKNLLKRAKFSPAAQQSNEERQKATAAAEKKEQAQVKPIKPSAAKEEGGLEGLRARLAVKIQAMREQRKAEEKTGKKRPSRAEAAAEQRALKKRKTATNKSKAKAEKREQEAAAKAEGETQAKKEAEATVDAASISYGSLLLDDGNEKDNKPKTRHGQSVRGIQNLLKKAERNAQRLEELKKTEEGKEKAKAKGWDTALQQAAGKVVMDDPKLLRAKLKKKEKAKTKSSKEWKERTAKLEVSKKERQKKKLANTLGRGKKDAAKPAEKKGRKGPRAGFEGKKGEAFLNADKKGGKPAGKKAAGPSK